MVFRFQEDYDTLTEPCPPKHHPAKEVDLIARFTILECEKL
jgi:hypothetical protein